MKKYIAFVFCLLFIMSKAIGASPDLTLESVCGQLAWNAGGLSISPKVKSPSILGAPRPIWAMVLMYKPAANQAKREKIVIESTNQHVEQEKSRNGFDLFYPSVLSGGQSFDISLRLYITVHNDAFRITGEIDNRTNDWTVMEFTGPVLNEIKSNPAEYPILWPSGLGMKIASCPSAKLNSGWSSHNENFQMIGTYPATDFNMQFITFAGKEGGLYIGSPDATHESKQFVLYHYVTSKNWKVAVNHLCCIPPKTVWKRGLVDILPYSGTWHIAADFYRREMQAWRSDSLIKPNWVDESNGMFLVIMNQQNNRHTMWNYDQIGTTMSDAADRQGFDTIGLFGWHQGGHDALYPQMLADPLLGGREKLIRGIAQAHQRGKKVCLYANGQLIDRELKDFWQKEGEKFSIVQSNGKVNNESWTIYDDTPGHVFGRACLHSERWYHIMLDLAVDAQRLGADGILYDQLSVNPPQHCWSLEHGHSCPTMTHGVSGSQLMERIERDMKKIDPGFIVMTEGFNDSAIDVCAYFHTIGYALYGTPGLHGVLQDRDNAPENGPFRSLFRYTWPDVAMTVRNPLPMLHPRFANMACVFGLKNEVEIRFPADVKALQMETELSIDLYKEDHLSQSRLYTLSAGLSDFRKMSGKYCMDYTKAVARFRIAHKDLLLKGRFVDEVGFTHVGKVVAKAFVNGKRIGVVVWNPEDKPMSFKIEVPKARFISAHEPNRNEVLEPHSPLAPNSIRLLIWEH